MASKVFVAMSGGVDSSVAAVLLKQKGYDLVGCFIRGWYPKGFYCDWKEDRRDAMRVCAKLGISFITIDAEKEYKRDVVDYMLREYKAGRTPNPDVMCNKNIKFGIFLKKALSLGADYIATGHYVKIENCKLKIARDLNKDQSYFLWTLTQKQLKHCLFPIGDLLKPQVRELARKNNLPTAEKDESMGVCFIGEFPMADFLKKYIKPKKGKVVTADGKIVGEHEGVMFYTIGQRHGWGGLARRSFSEGGVPYYIVAKNIKKNLIIVADKAREEKFYKKEVEIENINWVSGKPPSSGKTYKARIRYRQPLQSCKIEFQKGLNKMRSLKFGNILVKFSKPQRAVTPGQSLVIYDGPSSSAGKKTMLGGGIIK
ncbi:MAG: tRNA 2-thiouridine(34) synthase MnmA [Candidatus Terrybacteria bacterium]|nr:tRNA 2-thiouridine(34) synthase MnmA [Candidatus Terrybacteria bacterium]